MKTLSKHIFCKVITPKISYKSSLGFTLVEIMVAMVIGLLGVIVIMQVFSLFEGQKRTTTGGADAQNNGAIALYGLQRDIRQSGWGINATKLIGCNLTLPPATPWTLKLAPVTINAGAGIVPPGDNNTDTLLIIYGNNTGATEGDEISAQLSPNLYGVASPTTFNTDDYVIAEQPNRTTPCNLNLEKATVVTPKVNVVPVGVANMQAGSLFNMGSKPKILAYRVRLGNLTVCDYTVNNCGLDANKNNSDIWVPIADNIVSLRAQYGRDTNAKIDGIVDIYDQTTPATETDASSPKNNCDWLKISSIRLVIVARSAQPEKTLVTDENNQPQWMGQGTSSDETTTSAPIVLTDTSVPDGFTWQNYRYKTFQTIVPIRNITPVVASAKNAGC